MWKLLLVGLGKNPLFRDSPHKFFRKMTSAFVFLIWFLQCTLAEIHNHKYKTIMLVCFIMSDDIKKRALGHQKPWYLTLKISYIYYCYYIVRTCVLKVCKMMRNLISRVILFTFPPWSLVAYFTLTHCPLGDLHFGFMFSLTNYIQFLYII